MSDRDARAAADDLFLPNFCDMGTVFTVVVVGELLAFVLVLTSTQGAADWWRDLALTSMFVQWVALSSTGLLCISRGWLRRLGNVLAGVVAYGLILAVTLALSEAAFWLVAQPVLDLEQLLRTGRLEIVPPATHADHGEFLVVNASISAIVSAVALRYFYVQHQWKQNVESEARSRIQALQSRIRPHFLFNSMNTIASLTRSSPELAEQVTEDLAELFRVSLGDASIPATLGRELDICRQYLRIEKHRLGERVEARFETDDLPKDALLPGLTLQPLAENAVYHGIEPAPTGGVITIGGVKENDEVVLRITNTLPNGAAGSERSGNRMAQDNVAQRLRAFFGPQASLGIDAAGAEYVVELRFPYMRERP